MSESNLLILGASTRAAAFSAIRAGFHPWCADLFGDVDLRQHCPVTVLPAEAYPQGFLRIIDQAPVAPWIYTGALENRPRLLAALALRRPLWGNAPPGLAIVRSPYRRTALLQDAGIACPAVVVSPQAPARDRRWLLKPLAGAGGAGIRFWDERSVPPATASPCYLQEYIDGEPCSALYIGDGQHARLLGVTRQLIGLNWLHASPFHYCGSIGPCVLAPVLQHKLERVGEVLTNRSDLRGLFGVDYVLASEEPWPVEVNPRYTASVEILEHTLGICVLALHGRAFDPSLRARSETPPVRAKVLGKAILFAREDLVVPADAPWQVQGCEKVPSFADIPAVGHTIARGRPVLTLFAAADSMAACEEALWQKALDLDRWLFGR